jgi:hypothetical protein
MQLDDPKLSKPSFCRCTLAREGSPGCGVYGNGHLQPAVCRAYKCLWLLGFVPEDLRPDLAGVVFDFRAGLEGPYCAVTELHTGAHRAERIQKIIANLARRMKVQINEGPPHEA